MQKKRKYVKNLSGLPYSKIFFKETFNHRRDQRVRIRRTVLCSATDHSTSIQRVIKKTQIILHCPIHLHSGSESPLRVHSLRYHLHRNGVYRWRDDRAGMDVPKWRVEDKDSFPAEGVHPRYVTDPAFRVWRCKRRQRIVVWSSDISPYVAIWTIHIHSGVPRILTWTAARVPRRRAHVALIGFESVDLMIGGSFISKSVGCCREDMLDACDPPASKWCFRGTARVTGRFKGKEVKRETGEHELFALFVLSVNSFLTLNI